MSRIWFSLDRKDIWTTEVYLRKSSALYSLLFSGSLPSSAGINADSYDTANLSDCANVF